MFRNYLISISYRVGGGGVDIIIKMRKWVNNNFNNFF